MLLGHRLRSIREAKGLSQGDIEKRCGLKRSYVSRVEGSHKIPSVDTLEKWARALQVPLYQLFYEGKRPPKLTHLREWKTADEIAWGRTTKEARLLEQFRRLLACMTDAKRGLLLHIARKMARR